MKTDFVNCKNLLEGCVILFRDVIVALVCTVADEDSISDWSTDSCGWSDDDFGADVDLTTPPMSVDSGAVDTSDQEIVRCICEVEEENDFMIQVSPLVLICLRSVAILFIF